MAVDGTYAVKVEAKGHKVEGTVELVTNGSQLTGTVSGMGMTVPIQNGKVSGQQVSGVVEGPTPLGTMRFKVTGAVTGDTISGKMRAGLISVGFTGTRV